MYSLYFFTETVQTCGRADVQTCYCVILSLRAHRANYDVALCSDRAQDCKIKVQNVTRVSNLDLSLFYFVTDFVCLV